MDFNKLIKILFSFFKNKFLLTLFIFIIWISFFDKNNLSDRYNDNKTLKQIKKDKEYYLNQIEEDKKRIEELRTNNDNLEKFAREQYLMKKKNEDVSYIVFDE